MVKIVRHPRCCRRGDGCRRAGRLVPDQGQADAAPLVRPRARVRNAVERSNSGHLVRGHPRFHVGDPHAPRRLRPSVTPTHAIDHEARRCSAGRDDLLPHLPVDVRRLRRGRRGPPGTTARPVPSPNREDAGQVGRERAVHRWSRAWGRPASMRRRFSSGLTSLPRRRPLRWIPSKPCRAVGHQRHQPRAQFL